MGIDRGRYGWPALMRTTTAREYLDGMSLEQFDALVAPHLDAWSVDDEVRYTRQSLDAWIDAGSVSSKGRASQKSRRSLDPGVDRIVEHDPPNKLPALAPPPVLERLGLIPAEDVAEMLGLSLKTLKNKPRAELPEFVKAGRRWLFRLDSVREYLTAHTVR